MEIVEFLEQRLAEDEAEIARRVASGWNTRRRLREVAAKRAMMAELAPIADFEAREELDNTENALWEIAADSAQVVLVALASVWVDHPDFDPAWAPTVEAVRG